MDMTKYYIHYNIIWAVLSSFLYLFEKGLDEKAEMRVQTWANLSARVANWLMDERESFVGNNMTLEQRNRLDANLETAGDNLIFRTYELIKGAEDYPARTVLTKDEIDLYHYMRWLIVVIDELGQIKHGESDKLETPSPLLQLRHFVAIEIQEIERLDLPDLLKSSGQISNTLMDYLKHQIAEL
jgi:hypothetical protein